MITHVRKVSENGKESLRVVGNYPKEVIHSKENSLLHATVLILVVRMPKQEGDECKFILCNKAPKVLKLPMDIETDQVFWDTAGGHCEDFPADTEFDDTMWLSTAKRELSEEVLVNGKPAVPSENFRPLCKIEYGPADMPDGGINHEISQVFVYEAEDGDVILQDDYKADGHGTVTRRFMTREFSLSQLLLEYGKSPQHFMDGIGRIIEYFISNFEKETVGMLNNQKENKDSANASLHNIYYYCSKCKKNITDKIKIPQKCGDCPFISTQETYSHYDDLEGFDVYDNEIICKKNGMTIKNYRSEGSRRFDYGYEDRAMESKPINCPLQ